LTTTLDEPHALGPLAQFPARVLGVVERVIGCDSATYHEINSPLVPTGVLVEPHEWPAGWYASLAPVGDSLRGAALGP